MSKRVRYTDGVEAEFGFTTKAWADIRRDDGRVRVRDGFKILGPEGLLNDAMVQAEMEGTERVTRGQPRGRGGDGPR